MSVDGSVGVGRDADFSRRESIGSQFLDKNAMDIDDVLSHRSKSRDLSEQPFGMDIDFGPVDLGDMGIGFDLDGQKTPGQTRSSRACKSLLHQYDSIANLALASPLTDVPLTPPPEMAVDGTPVPPKPKRKIKEKKQIIDSVIELPDGLSQSKAGRARNNGLGAAVNKDVSDILTEPHFLPRSTVVMRLLEIRNDPLAHFLPTKVTPEGTFVCVAPPGLAPELAEMFMLPAHGTSSKRRAGSPGKSPNKRARLDGSVHGDDEVEQARRAGSLAPSAIGSEIVGGGEGLEIPDQSGVFEDYQLDIPQFEPAEGVDFDGKSVASRLSTPALEGMLFDEMDESYADATCPIAAFDTHPATQSQGTEREVEQTNIDGKGYSRNTIKALNIIRRELRPVDGDDNEEKVLSFANMAHKVCDSLSFVCC